MNIKIIRVKDYTTVQTLPIIADILKMADFNFHIQELMPHSASRDHRCMFTFSHSKLK